MTQKILVINPGATTTKIAVFHDEQPILQEALEHSASDLGGFQALMDQLPYRKEIILNVLRRGGIDEKDFTGVVGRGGLLASMEGGTYEVCGAMMDDLRTGRYGYHASNMGAILANEFARIASCKAYIVDPVSTNELEPYARVSGLPDFERVGKFHALNHKAVARGVAAELGMPYDKARFIVAHLGTGVSVGAHMGGRVVDINDPMNEGTFSADRPGTLPCLELVNLCYSRKYTHEEMKKKICGGSGYAAYIGTKDLREALAMADAGDENAKTILEAFVYQIAKDIASMSAVFRGKLDRIILTGGMAHSTRLVEAIRERVGFIAPLKIVPGEEEMRALALGTLRVLNGTEPAKSYELCKN